MQRGQQIRRNFLKVLVAAVTEPLQLVTLGCGLVVAVLFPAAALPILSLAIITVLARTVMMLGDDTFIQKVLKASSIDTNFLSDLITRINQRLKEIRFNSAVEQDLQAAKVILQKLLESWKMLDARKVSGQAGLIQDLVQKLVHKLLDLSRQEESVTNFLKQFNESALNQDLVNLAQQLTVVSDPIAKEEYQKALNLKQSQKDALQKIKNSLDRINSYNARIIAELENTQTYLARLAVDATHQMDYGETDYLSSSLQSLINDLNTFEELNLEVSREVRQMVREDVARQKH